MAQRAVVALAEGADVAEVARRDALAGDHEQGLRAVRRAVGLVGLSPAAEAAARAVTLASSTARRGAVSPSPARASAAAAAAARSLPSRARSTRPAATAAAVGGWNVFCSTTPPEEVRPQSTAQARSSSARPRSAGSRARAA